MQDVVPSRATSLADLLASVADGTLDQGLAPLENAIEGTVSATIDGLVFDHELVIVRRDRHPDPPPSARAPGVTIEDLTSVRSYVHALAQCRGYLHGLWVSRSNRRRRRRRRRARSPSRANRGPRSRRRWPVSSSDLVALATDIEDHPDNATRFVVVGRDTSPRPPVTTGPPSSASRTPTGPVRSTASSVASPPATSTSRSSRAARRSAVWATTAS
jgi:prephenate dehydratase